MVLCGDFRQVLPVVPKASRAGVVRACIKRSPLWPLFRVFHLTENMRVLSNGNDQRLLDWDAFLLELGNGSMPTIDDTEYVELPAELCVGIDNTSKESLECSQREFIHEVYIYTYPDLERNYATMEKDELREWLSERGILAPKNDAVDELNAICLGMLPGEENICLSADSVLHDEQAAAFPAEFLNSMRATGMPPHRLVLKPGCMLMMLRNLSKRSGLCNGTRLIFEGMQGMYLLKCKIASGEHKGVDVLIPRILTQPSDFRGHPCEWRRQQFPVRVAHAMTINKSQGQTFKRAGVWLESPVFSHGQLYVAASRVGHPDGIKFAIAPAANIPARFATKNVVYHEVLTDDTN